MRCWRQSHAAARIENEGLKAENEGLKAELSEASLPPLGWHMMVGDDTVSALTGMPGEASLLVFRDLLNADGFLASIRLRADTGFDCRVRHHEHAPRTGP